MPRVIITVPDQTPQPYRFLLDRQAVQLGRGSDNDIAINCASVSVHHAVMERIEGGYQIRDLDSTNGSKLDGARMPIIPLRDGLSVKLGDVSFDFSLSDEEKEALAREKPPADSEIVKEDPEAVKPKKPVKKSVKRSYAPTETKDSAQGALMIVVFAILAALAFFIGLSIRHEKDTGQSLIKSIMDKGKTTAAESVPAPSSPEGATTAEGQK
ncbi:MAG: FHA domain-containing protein [Verrucomicrobia bacterium]|nr:FHA domain-containing protein [Verrucomicrobiota bacterium]